MSLNRRNFLKGVGTLSGAAIAGSFAGLGSRKMFASSSPQTSLVPPDQSGIEHIIVVTMENRSFDHFLGWMPGTNGQQSGLTYLDPQGKPHNTYRLAPDWKGCGHPDPDHSYTGARVEYNGGKMDGFLTDTANDIYCIGYYEQKDIPFYGQLALNYTTLSQSFPSILGPTFPNRIFMHAAQTDRLTDSFFPSFLPTIWDHLQAADVSANYYYSNVPFLGLWGTKYTSISKTYSQFLDDPKKQHASVGLLRRSRVHYSGHRSWHGRSSPRRHSPRRCFPLSNLPCSGTEPGMGHDRLHRDFRRMGRVL